MSQVNYFSPPPPPPHLSAQTGSLRIHLFQPRYYHPSTTSPRHTNMFCRLSWKHFSCYFLVQSRPNTIANQQHIVIWHYKGRWNATWHELSCLEAGHRPLCSLRCSRTNTGLYRGLVRLQRRLAPLKICPF